MFTKRLLLYSFLFPFPPAVPCTVVSVRTAMFLQLFLHVLSRRQLYVFEKNVFLICLTRAVTYWPIVHWFSLQLVLINKTPCYCSAVQSSYCFIFLLLVPGQPGQLINSDCPNPISDCSFPKSPHVSWHQFPCIHPPSVDMQKNSAISCRKGMECCDSLEEQTTFGFLFAWEN